MRKIMLVLSFISIVFLFPCALANSPVKIPMVNAISNIQDLEQSIEELKTKIKVPVVFPKVIPKPDKKYYAHADLTYQRNNTDYVINIDFTKDCKGGKYCNIGYIRAEKNQPIQKYEDMERKNITIPVVLANHKEAYFTPGHPAGDYFPPTIQWQENGVLYTISWNGNLNQDEKTTLMEMANSAFPR